MWPGKRNPAALVAEAAEALLSGRITERAPGVRVAGCGVPALRGHNRNRGVGGRFNVLCRPRTADFAGPFFAGRAVYRAWLVKNRGDPRHSLVGPTVEVGVVVFYARRHGTTEVFVLTALNATC